LAERIGRFQPSAAATFAPGKCRRAVRCIERDDEIIGVGERGIDPDDVRDVGELARTAVGKTGMAPERIGDLGDLVKQRVGGVGRGVRQSGDLPKRICHRNHAHVAVKCVTDRVAGGVHDLGQKYLSRKSARAIGHAKHLFGTVGQPAFVTVCGGPHEQGSAVQLRRVALCASELTPF